MEKGVTPLFGSRRMKDVNYLMLIYYPVPAKFSKNVPASMTPGEKEETCGE